MFKDAISVCAVAMFITVAVLLVQPHCVLLKDKEAQRQLQACLGSCMEVPQLGCTMMAHWARMHACVDVALAVVCFSACSLHAELAPC